MGDQVHLMMFKGDLTWQKRGPYLPEISIPNGGGMRNRIRLRRAAIFGSAVVGTSLSLSGIGLAVGTHGVHGPIARQRALIRYLKSHGGQTTATNTPTDGDLAGLFAQYGFERTAPAGFVSGAALVSAQKQAAQLPVMPGTWQEFTTQPYNAEPAGFTDPVWSNTGAGLGLVGGRAT